MPSRSGADRARTLQPLRADSESPRRGGENGANACGICAAAGSPVDSWRRCGEPRARRDDDAEAASSVGLRVSGAARSSAQDAAGGEARPAPLFLSVVGSPSTTWRTSALRSSGWGWWSIQDSNLQVFGVREVVRGGPPGIRKVRMSGIREEGVGRPSATLRRVVRTGGRMEICADPAARPARRDTAALLPRSGMRE